MGNPQTSDNTVNTSTRLQNTTQNITLSITNNSDITFYLVTGSDARTANFIFDQIQNKSPITNGETREFNILYNSNEPPYYWVGYNAGNGTFSTVLGHYITPTFNNLEISQSSQNGTTVYSCSPVTDPNLPR